MALLPDCSPSFAVLSVHSQGHLHRFTIKVLQSHRRRLKTEEMQKSSRLFGGAELVQSLPRYFTAGQIWRIGWIRPFLQIMLVQNRLRGKEMKQFCPPNSSGDLCLLFCLYPSSMCRVKATWSRRCICVEREPFLWIGSSIDEPTHYSMLPFRFQWTF